MSASPLLRRLQKADLDDVQRRAELSVGGLRQAAEGVLQAKQAWRDSPTRRRPLRKLLLLGSVGAGAWKLLDHLNRQRDLNRIGGQS
jgi:hypothetical protein